jgi:immunoglobulin-like protein involved in spore germination
MTVAGTANVFEATVTLRLLDASGREIATRFTTATCGSGCRGSWSVSVPYRLGRIQRGTVHVYEVSARDGTRRHVVNVPVLLAAAP